jgi:hypothetical protein
VFVCVKQGQYYDRKLWGIPPKGNRRYLTVYKTLRVLSPIKVDRIVLSIGRKKIIPHDWESYEVTGDESGYIDFDRPGWLPNGNHSARLIAYTPDGYSKSDKFTLEVKDQLSAKGYNIKRWHRAPTAWATNAFDITRLVTGATRKRSCRRLN